MRVYLIPIGLFIASIAHADGPISKFDPEVPVIDLVTQKPIFEIERCLIDLPGLPAPQVYRQPDKPDQVTLLYLVANKTAGRIDLLRTASGTQIKGRRMGRASRCI